MHGIKCIFSSLGVCLASAPPSPYSYGAVLKVLAKHDGGFLSVHPWPNFGGEGLPIHYHGQHPIWLSASCGRPLRGWIGWPSSTRMSDFGQLWKALALSVARERGSEGRSDE